MVLPPKDAKRYIITPQHIQLAAQELGKQIANYWSPIAHIYGIPRGGVCAAYAVMAYAQQPDFRIVMDPLDCDVIVDDLVDTGHTRSKYRRSHNKKGFAVLFDKSPARRDYVVGLPLVPETGWLVFPWEAHDEF